MELRRAVSSLARSSSYISPSSQLCMGSRHNLLQTRYTYRAISSTANLKYLPPTTRRAPESADSKQNAPTIRTSSPTPNEDTLDSIAPTNPLDWIHPNSKPSSHSVEIKGSSKTTSNTSNTSSMFGSLSRPPPRNSNPSSGNATFADLQFPERSRSSSTDIMAEVANTVMMPPENSSQRPLRLSPSTGRTVDIGTNIDLPRGIRMLEMSCAQNKVRHDANLQRFHERGGAKRKRLRRERWRRKFMAGFKGLVGRVKQLKHQGW